jgi:hypothetical protein
VDDADREIARRDRLGAGGPVAAQSQPLPVGPEPYEPHRRPPGVDHVHVGGRLDLEDRGAAERIHGRAVADLTTATVVREAPALGS